MPPAFAEQCARQHGLFTARQAYGAGISREALRWRAGPGGIWQPVAGRVFASFTGTLTEAQRLQAGLLYGGEGALLAGTTACRVLGLRATLEDRDVHVLVPLTRNLRRAEFIVAHRTRNFPRARRVHGWPSCPPALALVQAAAGMASLADVRALVAEAVQRRLVTVEGVEAQLRSGLAAGALPQVLAEVQAGVRSPAEAEFLALIRASGLPEPLVNVPIRLPDGSRVIPDFRWGRLIVELDSREWHLAPEHWRRDLNRGARLVAAGYRLLRFTPADVRHEPERVAGLIGTALMTAA